MKDNPYSQNPIDENSLNLFVGRKKEIEICSNALSTTNSRIVIEGGRGVGTTSLANYVRYTLAKNSNYLTPNLEISVARNWNQALLLSNVLSAVVYAFEGKHKGISKNRKFNTIKKATQVIEQKYKTAGLQAFGFGGQLGTSSVVSLPSIIPTTTLTQYMNDLAAICGKKGYSKGVIIHLNNLDIETIFEPEVLKHLLNEIRDIFQLKGYHWLLIGDEGLRGFIGSNVDRLDDIISAKIRLQPLTIKEVEELIKKRIRYFSISKKHAAPPINFEVVKYLYDLTNGRLRYIFGMCSRLLSLVSTEALIHSIDLKFAKPIIKKLAEERIVRRKITDLSLKVLRTLVKLEKATPTKLSKKLNQGQTSISRCLKELLNQRLVKFEKSGQKHIYSPSLDAKLAL